MDMTIGKSAFDLPGIWTYLKNLKIEVRWFFLRESNPRFPYKSTVNIILMNSSVHMLKQSKNS